jgi:hypothetical protein
MDFIKALSDTHKYSAGDLDWRPNDELKKGLEGHSGYIGMVINSSKIGPCDFGVAYEDGYMALIPHVGFMRQSARVLGADARRLWMDGKTDEAGERLVTIVRMSNHARADKLAISSLVSAALMKDAHAEVRAMDKAGRLTDSVKKAVAETLSAFPAKDPCGIKNSIAAERGMSSTYLRTRLNTDGTKVLEEMLAVNHGEEAAIKENMMKLSKEEALKEVERMDQYFQQVADVWENREGRTAKLTALAEKVKAGEYGVLGMAFLPSITKLAENEEKSEKELADFRKLVGGK